MDRLNQRVLFLAGLTILLVVSLSTPAFAAINSFIAIDDGGECYEYSYEDLLDSFAMKALGLSNGLYEDFANRKTIALLTDAGNYIDYQAILDRYSAALIGGENFDLMSYLGSVDAKKAAMPSSVNLVRLVSGNIAMTLKNISAKNTENIENFTPPKSKTAITGNSTVSLEQAQRWALNRQAHQRFIDIAPLYWQYGQQTGIRAEVLYAQAAIETSFGHYGSTVKPEDNNWAGIKTAAAEEGSSGSHEKFATPEEGVRAHFNHISAYLGLPPVGEPHGRYHIAVSQPWAGAVMFVEDLSGKWAPPLDYHVYVLTLLDQLYKTETSSQSGNSSNEQGNNAPPPDGDSTTYRVMVDCDILHLRGGPGTDHTILDRLTRGTILVVNGNQNEWLKVLTANNQNGWVHGDYVVNVGNARPAEPSAPIKPLDLFIDKIIVVDPGHGGSDPGATGFSGLQEKVVNLAVGKHLAELLQQSGAKVILTRTGDQSVGHQQRVDLANKSGAHIYISIHANAFSNPESNGTETHYCGKNGSSAPSKYLAEQVQRELVSVLQLRDRGVKTSSFYVLTNVKMPASLVELGFMSNAREEALLSSPEVQRASAEAIYRGLAAYFQKYR